ncbi:MAG: hypothetical protein AAB893_04885, partial [Patescibacteria group bacterium]
MELHRLSGAELRKLLKHLLPAFALVASACSASLTPSRSVEIIPLYNGFKGNEAMIVTDSSKPDIVEISFRSLDRRLQKNAGDFINALEKWLAKKGKKLKNQVACLKHIAADSASYFETPIPGHAITPNEQVAILAESPLFIDLSKGATCKIVPIATSTAKSTQTPTRTSTPTTTKLVSPTLAAKVLNTQSPKLNATVSATWPVSTPTTIPFSTESQNDEDLGFPVAIGAGIALAVIFIGGVTYLAFRRERLRRTSTQVQVDERVLALAKEDATMAHGMFSGFGALPFRERVTGSSDKGLTRQVALLRV